ncbi:hypothetical protein SAMN04488515_2465 [Cognatiyoonia koreensis]|uniref:Uncharacterized protein n=1 Tax=Cognatiyoonia koreensis TaxID=364200 RepID=A0A1I0RCT9_9RHOB|nr:hypothetical protein [Cognatiyoonia koreensis]SEW38411.1 hypothetical protein SAMN04488515_2465 [Cognatiyoonia koreensis]
MSSFLPEEVRKGLEAARKASLRRNDRLCIHDGEDVYRIRRFWADGLSIDIKHGDKLRGRVEIYDGARHVYQCLIENGRTEDDECVFDFKWLHPVAEQPAADFVRPDALPAGLIGKAY